MDLQFEILAINTDGTVWLTFPGRDELAQFNIKNSSKLRNAWTKLLGNISEKFTCVETIDGLLLIRHGETYVLKDNKLVLQRYNVALGNMMGIRETEISKFIVKMEEKITSLT